MAEGNWELGDLRTSIDNLDQALLLLLAERFRLVRRILDLKTLYHVDYKRSIARELDLKTLAQFSREQGLDVSFLTNLLNRFYQIALAEAVAAPAQDPTQLGLSLDQLRASLLHLEQTLVLVLTERFQVVRLIGRVKARLSLPPRDNRRFQALLEERITQGQGLGLPRDLVQDLYERIHQHALSLEQDQMG